MASQEEGEAGVSAGYEIVESRRQFRGEVFTVDVDMLRLPDGQVREREVVHHRGAVGIVAVTTGDELLLVSQYRHPARRFLTEIPAGKLDAGEAPDACATRELREETGARPDAIRKIAEFYTTPGYSDERFHMFLATGCRLGETRPEDDEEQDMRLLRVPIGEALAMARGGRFEDGKTIVGILLADLHLRQDTGS